MTGGTCGKGLRFHRCSNSVDIYFRVDSFALISSPGGNTLQVIVEDWIVGRYCDLALLFGGRILHGRVRDSGKFEVIIYYGLT